MPERDELDLLIDSGLAGYAEPRPGFEQRLLARVEAEPRGTSGILRGWRTWTLAGAMAAGIVLLAVIPWIGHREVAITTARVVKPDHGSVAVPAPKIAVPEVHVRRLPRVVRSGTVTAEALASIKSGEDQRSPKLDVFPAPRPLSAQERALVAIATVPSDSGRKSLLTDQRQIDAPLQISSIQIAPIMVTDEGKN